jgi:hypothetical protein
MVKQKPTSAATKITSVGIFGLILILLAVILFTSTAEHNVMTRCKYGAMGLGAEISIMCSEEVLGAASRLDLPPLFLQ